MTAPDIDAATGRPIGQPVDASPARRPERVALQGRTVVLAPLDPNAHTDALYERAHGPEAEAVWLYLGRAPPADKAEFRAYIEQSAASEDPLFFAVLDPSTGAALGHATYMRIEPAQRVIEVGNILYTPALQRTPAATEAMYLMARHAFEDLGYRRYEWKCNALNAPSRRAAERLGFTYEGTFRQHMIVKGRNRDTAWYSMLDREWPDRKRAFERWLDPANFDATGRQRLSLSALNATEIAPDAVGIALRRAQAEDLSRLARLQHKAYAANRAVLGVEPLPLMFDYATLAGFYEAWLVEGPDGLRGALILDPRPDHLLIWSVATAPAVQGSGLGGRLLAAAEARARQLGLPAIRLYTGDKLTRNVRWYHRHGYAIDRVEELPDRRAVHMVKHLV